MKTNLLIFFLFNIYTINAQNFVRLSEVDKHRGETVSLSGRITNAAPQKDELTNSTLLLISNDCLDEPLVVAISEQVRQSLNYKALDSLANKRIWVTGKLEDMAGKTRLTITNPKDLEIVNNDFDKLFTKVEHPPPYPGGIDKWRSFLNENLDKTVVGKDARRGKKAVKVQFIIDTEGQVSKVQAIEVPKGCPACGPEAVRVLRKSERWMPAIQNCRKVVFQAVEIIPFD